MIKAVFFDMDGTLISHKKGEVPESARRALEKLREKGIRCVAATGRHRLEMDRLPVKDMEFDGYITLNGQLCLDKEGNVVAARPIAGKAKQEILRLFSEKVLPVMLVEQNAMYINYIDDRVRAAQKEISTPLPRPGKYSGAEIYMAVTYLPEEEEERLKQLLPGCRITRWNRNGLDIIDGQGGKARGVEEYIRAEEIQREETMAFGDGENDREMLAFVGTGIAMGNAAPAVKEWADWVAPSVDEDGIAAGLAHFGLI